MACRDSYDYDVFLSYRREYPVNDWVHNHFKKQLQAWLNESAPYDARIFVDTDAIETGSDWPAEIENALKRSCILVAVWSPSYFRSRWCVAELATMRKRERILKLRTAKTPRGLIFPVRFHDGEHFPPDVASFQYFDVSVVNRPELSFKDSAEFATLIDRVQRLSKELHAAIERVPAWSDKWPVVTPEPETEASMNVELPRL